MSGQTMRLTDAELEADLARTRFVLSSTLLTGEERKAWNEHEDAIRREIRLRARRPAPVEEEATEHE